MRALLDQPVLRCASGLRNRLLLEFLYRGGLELFEALSLRDADVGHAGPQAVRLRVEGRGGRSRLVTIRSERVASSFVPRWRELRPLAPERFFCAIVERECGTGFGGPMQAGQPLHDSYVRAMVTRHAEKAGLDPSLVCPRALRHSHAVHALAAGADLRQVQLRLGHARRDTTARYLDYADQGGRSP